MKQYWERLSLKVDALSLRERVIIFVLAALVLLVLVNAFLLDPQYRAQKQLSDRIRDQQTQTAALQAAIRQQALDRDSDPVQANTARLRQLQGDLDQVRSALGNLQQGLIAPDRMAALLEDILKRNRGVQLVSLKTLPASAIVSIGEDAAKADAKADDKTASRPPQAAGGIYKHGVQLVIRGPYLEIMNTLAQLETMPWQLFWSQASLGTEHYPDSTLTLTLYTLSLDAKWMKL
ncbi:MAG TPA: MSHA biogenesis protein MshJ [Noviherbaspirillum sp.]|jgi:MSHA biogenesis protein MshJ|uniref:MSHA biogenesis protein MshJ n=1 Tax=Noviherbaspirillum sp. TaxID=1926288 RepID=UPI002F930098